jgi:hypothetical protein
MNSWIAFSSVMSECVVVSFERKTFAPSPVPHALGRKSSNSHPEQEGNRRSCLCRNPFSLRWTTEKGSRLHKEVRANKNRCGFSNLGAVVNVEEKQNT